MPDTIHVPPMAPMSSKMTIEEVHAATFLVISLSRLSHFSRPWHHPTKTHTPEATNSDIWLAPSNVALPKTEIQQTRSAMSTKKGMNATML